MSLPDGFDLQNAKLMGIQLVKILSEQLGSELRHSAGEGTSFHIEFPEYREAGTEVHGSSDHLS